MPRQVIWYFPHDASLSDQKQMVSLRIKYGPAGYGLIMMLYEWLLNHKNLDWDKIMEIKDAFCVGADSGLLNNVIEYAMKIGILTKDKEGFIISPFIEDIRIERERNLRNDRERKANKSTPHSPQELISQNDRKIKTNNDSYSKESGGNVRIPTETTIDGFQNQRPTDKQSREDFLLQELNKM